MPPQSQSHSSAKPRYVYIDLLRGWAVFVMIETHVTNAFILPAIRLEPWFNVVNFTNGIVAPSFLFVAGYAFAIVGQRKWNDYLAFNWVFWKQIGRILQIWIIGYALHLPFFSFHKLAYLIGWEEWTSFWPVDVLQCIAVSLLLMLLLVVVTRNRRTFFLVLCAISALVVFATPYTATLNIDDIFSLPFSNYLNALHGSLFPLFPWMGFLLSGGVVGQLLVFWKEKRPEREYFRYIGIGGVAMILVSIAARFIPITIYPPHEFWVSSPEFVFIRLGIVLMILAGLWFWEQRYSSGRSLVSLLGFTFLSSTGCSSEKKILHQLSGRPVQFRK